MTLTYVEITENNHIQISINTWLFISPFLPKIESFFKYLGRFKQRVPSNRQEALR